MDDKDLLDELKERIKEGPVIFTPDNDFLDRLNPEDAVDTVENHIHQIEVPTLVIAAECDSHIPRWHCEVYRDKIPNAQLSIIPNGDHDFVQTHSDEISNLLKIHWSELINLA